MYLDDVLGIWDGVLVIYYIVLGIFDGAQGASKECIAMALTTNIGSCQPQSQSTIEGPKPVMWTPPGEEVQAPRRETKIWTVTAWGALRLVATVNSWRAPA